MSDFKPADGKWSTRPFASKTGTLYEVGDPIYNDGTNNIAAVSTTDKALGICAEGKLAATTGTANILMWVPDGDATFEAPVTTGAIAKDDEGQSFDFTDKDGVDATGSTENVVRLVQFLTTTKGIFTFNTGKNT